MFLCWPVLIMYSATNPQFPAHNDHPCKMYYDRPRKRDNKKKDFSPARRKNWFKKRAAVNSSAKGPAQLKHRRVIHAPKKKRHRLLKTFLVILLLLVSALSALYFIPVSSLGRQSAPGASVSLPSGYTHVLLIGIDADGNETNRSDTMMILSVGESRVLLTSLQRDTGVTIPGKTRLNAAYAYGGTALLLETVNRNFGLNLSLYMLVDYDSFPELIDLIGGVDIVGIADSEIDPLNHNMRDILWRRYKAGSMTQEEIYLQYLKDELNHGGDLHLNGLQALGYARIRKTDSDYMRTSRQRKILTAALSALKGSGPVTLIRFASRAMGYIDTNMNYAQLLSLAEKAMLSSKTEQMRLPVGGTYTDQGSMFYNVDYRKNHDAFIEFVYGK